MDDYEENENNLETMKQAGGDDNDKSFVHYITSFSASEKAQLMNLVQYCSIAVIPLLAVLKIMKIYMPVNNPLKPTSELVVEVLIQLIVIVVAFFVIHKLVLYFPTYSQVNYENFSLLSGMLPLLFLMFTLDTKISEKLNVLFDRLLRMFGLITEPYDDSEEKDGKGNNEKNGNFTPPPPMQEPTQPAKMQTTSIEELSGMSRGGFQGSGFEGFEPVPANY